MVLDNLDCFRKFFMVLIVLGGLGCIGFFY